MAAAIATLQALGEPDFHDRLEAPAARLDEGLREAADAADPPVFQARTGSLLGFYFTDTPVIDLASANTCDPARFERFFHAMLDRGVLLPTSPFAPICVLAAHTNEQIDHTIEAARESLSIAGTAD
jgi:glutamate-1-semialdehyde 2,1-aminomutase